MKAEFLTDSLVLEIGLYFDGWSAGRYHSHARPHIEMPEVLGDASISSAYLPPPESSSCNKAYKICLYNIDSDTDIYSSNQIQRDLIGSEQTLKQQLLFETKMGTTSRF
jgi:hypothetical protein